MSAIETVNNFFNNPALRKTLVRSRVLIGITLFTCLLCFAKAEWFWAAFALSSFGELIQIWCFASLDKKRTLSTKGLYGIVRNPMYLGRLFIVLGYLSLFGFWYLLLIAVTAYIPYMTNRVKREEKALEEIFGTPYNSYRQYVGCFIPKSIKINLSELFFFKWELLRQNNGTRNLIGFLLSYLIVFLVLFVL